MWSRALAAAAVLGDAGAALARIGGDAGERAREMVVGWQGLDRTARARAVALAAAAVRAPVPAGADRIDRGWSEAALGDDPRARAAWEARRTGPVDVWWTRRVTAGWIAIPPEHAAATVDHPDELARWPADRIVRAMRRVGLAIVAHVTLEAGDVAVARIAAGIVDGAAMVELARRLRGDTELRAAMGPVRVAAARIQGIALGSDLGLGASAIARHLGGEASAQLRLIVPPDVAREMDGDGLEVGWQAIRAAIA
jgi:hypothetical protein